MTPATLTAIENNFIKIVFDNILNNQNKPIKDESEAKITILLLMKKSY